MFELIPDSFRGQARWEGERDSKAEDGLKVGQQVMIAEFQWAWQVRNRYNCTKSHSKHFSDWHSVSCRPLSVVGICVYIYI